MKVMSLIKRLEEEFVENGDIEVWIVGREGKSYPLEGSKVEAVEEEQFGRSKKKLLIAAHG